MKFFRRISFWWHRLWAINPFLWIRCHTFTKYHLVDCRNASDNYRYGWVDKPELILYANMAILTDFVEKEKGLEVIDWGHDDKNKTVAKEIKDIYEWWKIGRKQAIDELSAKRRQNWEKRVKLDSIYNEAIKGEFMAQINTNTPQYKVYLEERTKLVKERELLDEKDEEMMHRLINIRRWLWT
jgi:hypothetical protein